LGESREEKYNLRWEKAQRHNANGFAEMKNKEEKILWQ